MTERAACSRLSWFSEHMADSSYFRGKARQAHRLAWDSTDPVLQKGLTDLALDYFAQAIAVEATGLENDPEDE